MMKPYTSPSSILTLLTWVQHTQAWPSANSAHRLAFGQTKSYSVQPRLPLATKIGPVGQSIVFFYWVRPTSLMLERTYAWPSANSAHSLAFGQTESYSVQPCLPVAATIIPAGWSRVFFYWFRPVSLMVGPDYTVGWPLVKPNPTVCSLAGR